MAPDRPGQADGAADGSGHAATPDDAARWQLYLATTVLAELAPGVVTDLSGPDAVPDWPLDGTAYVLSAWNPYGRPRSEQRNARAHAALLERLEALGARWVPATGVDEDDTYREHGVLSVELDLDAALGVAGEFDQEALFRIDAERIEVVGVDGDATLARPRLARRHDAARLRGSRRASS